MYFFILFLFYSDKGYIDFDEFCHVMDTCAPRSLEEQLRETFKLIDKVSNIKGVRKDGRTEGRGARRMEGRNSE